MNNTRISQDEYFMGIADMVAKRSTCLRHQVGAVIVDDNKIVSTGYNGAPKKLPHCLDIGCLRDAKNIPSGTQHEICRAVHAEQNAIIQASINGSSSYDCAIYCTHRPCILCAKMIINAEIYRVFYRESYIDDGALEYFDKAGIIVTRLDGNLRCNELPSLR